MKIHDIETPILTEAIVDVDTDVELIYDTYFKDLYELIERSGRILSWWVDPPKRTTTAILMSPQCRQAHKKNPCDIIINNRQGGGNFYDATTQFISVRVPFHAIEAIEIYGEGDIENAARSLPPGQARSLLRELKPETIKASIHHELSHWVRDSMHGNILKQINKASERGWRTWRSNKSDKDVNAHHIEIDAIIHNIYQLKKKYADKWDLLWFDDMISLSPALNGVRFNLSRTGEYAEWKKKVLKRLHREGLLGKRMNVA